MARYCTNCGNDVGDGTHFCAKCGASVEASTPAAPSYVPLAPVPNRQMSRSTMLVAALAAVALIVGIAAVVIAHKKSTNAATVRVGGISVTSPTRVVRTPTTRKPRVLGRAYTQQLENIVQQSARGRGIVGPLVEQVKNCQVAPVDASSQIRAVIDNRTSVLNQLAGLAAAPNATTANLESRLQQALQSSIDADAQYKAWMDYLYADWYYTQGCPNGTPPTNTAFATAQRDDANSTALKSSFVGAFNPVASRFGLRTWQNSDF